MESVFAFFRFTVRFHPIGISRRAFRSRKAQGTPEKHYWASPETHRAFQKGADCFPKAPGLSPRAQESTGLTPEGIPQENP
jgi:hypothetical protein